MSEHRKVATLYLPLSLSTVGAIAKAITAEYPTAVYTHQQGVDHVIDIWTTPTPSEEKPLEQLPSSR